ncbi:hypothetical protein Q4Q35_18880 [Flavivirga aquimarina]|uniref:Uncharacterized protein n=1 Tax=Flavivirga aquimarina TaxID=2027862 RepID=A0ABT8WFL6_9FLAO|nr:hypothetical protein [Flavivirga aquimarina]MDO5971872.1 hypothetical protein [Flavivirga aquimarina]
MQQAQTLSSISLLSYLQRLVQSDAFKEAEKTELLRKILYIIGLSFSFFGIPLFYFMVINTGVSLKYETEFGECISQVSGVNLCEQQDLFLTLAYSCGIIFLFLIGILIYKTI